MTFPLGAYQGCALPRSPRSEEYDSLAQSDDEGMQWCAPGSSARHPASQLAGGYGGGGSEWTAADPDGDPTRLLCATVSATPQELRTVASRARLEFAAPRGPRRSSLNSLGSPPPRGKGTPDWGITPVLLLSWGVPAPTSGRVRGPLCSRGRSWSGGSLGSERPPVLPNTVALCDLKGPCGLLCLCLGWRTGWAEKPPRQHCRGTCHCAVRWPRKTNSSHRRIR